MRTTHAIPSVATRQLSESHRHPRRTVVLRRPARPTFKSGEDL